jgi:hypothetical protein
MTTATMGLPSCPTLVLCAWTTLLWLVCIGIGDGSSGVLALYVKDRREVDSRGDLRSTNMESVEHPESSGGSLVDSRDPTKPTHKDAFIVRLHKSVPHDEFETTLHARMAARSGPASEPPRITHRYHHVSYGVVVEGVSAEELESMPGVKSVHRVTEKKIQSYSWGIDRVNQPNLPVDRNTTFVYSGSGVDVYVVDTGIDATHIEFASGTRTVKNIFNAYGSVTTNTDGHGHGTHCAGTVGGATIGVARNANIYGLKVLSDSGSGLTSTIISALDLVQSRRASNGFRRSVVSMSLGGDCDVEDCSQDSLVLAVEEMVAAGIVVSVAAGNSACNSNYQSPAAAANAITGIIDILLCS